MVVLVLIGSPLEESYPDHPEIRFGQLPSGDNPTNYCMEFVDGRHPAPHLAWYVAP